MPRSRRLAAFVFAPSASSAARRLTQSLTALFLALALAVVTSTAAAQGRAGSDSPLHLAASRFEFVATGDSQPPSQPLRVHNGGTARFTDVRLTKLTYADSAHGVAWLVALPRQSAVSPDELATVGTLCVYAVGLPAGTYRATAAVVAREVPQPVAISITLVVTEAGARAPHAAGRCGTAAPK